MSNSPTRPSVTRLLSLRLPLVAALAGALVIGPTAVVDAIGDEAEPVDTSMEKVTVEGVSTDAVKDTADVEFNLPDAAQQHRSRAPRSEHSHGAVEPDDA